MPWNDGVAVRGAVIVYFCLMTACGTGHKEGDAVELKFTIPNTRGAMEDLVLDRFLFNGAAVDPKTLQVKTLSPGVHEVTAEARLVGEWGFAIKDLSNYYGFGERFDRLDHVHSILKNETRNTVGVKGNDTYQPVPFFMSLRGYGLWLDTFSEANSTSTSRNATAFASRSVRNKLRFVLFEGPRFPAHPRSLHRLGRAPAAAAILGVRPVEGARLPSQPGGGQRRHRPLSPAWPARIDHPDRQPLGDQLQHLRIQPEAVRRCPEMIAHLHDEGYKLILWHTPWINQKTSVPGEEGFADKIPTTFRPPTSPRPSGMAISCTGRTARPTSRDGGRARGSLIDFTNPAAKKWWQGQVGKAIAMGADGFKDDDAEGNFIGDVKFAER